MMKWHRFLYGLLFIMVVGRPAAAQLLPGDIVVIGVQSDGTDRFAWVPLVDLVPGQEVYFTDAGWNAEAHAFQRQVNATSNSSTTSPSGGAIRYTAPLQGLVAGTVVEVKIDRRTKGEPGAYTLTVTGASADDFFAANDTDVVGDQGLSIATTGDQLLVLTGSLLQPAFVFGVNTGADQWDLGSTTAQHASDLPPGLTEGLTAIAIGAGPDAGNEVDNGRYTGPATGTRETILAMIADRAHWETSDTAIDDLTGGKSLFDLIPADPVIVRLDTIFVAPGDTSRMPITIVNTTDRQVGFLRFRVILKGQAAFVQNPISGIPEGVDIETISVNGESLTVSVTPQFGQPSIITGDTLRIIGELRMIPDGDALGKTVGVYILKDTSFTAQDTSGLTLITSGLDGAVQVGIRGDINMDSRVNILDATSLVYRMIHDKLSAPGTIFYQTADVNADGLVNVVDVIGIIRMILGLPLVDAVQARTIHTAEAFARLHAPRPMDNHSLGILLSIKAGQHVAGLYAEFSFNSSQLRVSIPAFVDPPSDLIIESAIHQNVLRVVAASPSLSISSGEETEPTIIIPVRLLRNTGTDFSLTELILIDAQGQEIPVKVARSRQTVIAGKQVPDTFALYMNTPNPFNPRTQISYYVPRTARMTLKVYNLLGRQVIQLVDRKHAAGRYTTFWNARNNQGEPVASGIYLYRLTSDTGYVETRKMTLLK